MNLLGMLTDDLRVYLHMLGCVHIFHTISLSEVAYTCAYVEVQPMFCRTSQPEPGTREGH